jgi:putative peptide zinc metalloprotease protein
MSESFFTQSWYRVAGLRPRVANHVTVARHRYGSQSWYALSDPLSGRVHRVTPAAYLFAARMDGKRTVDAIWQEMVAEMDTEAPSQEAVVNLLMQLHGADLLAGDVPPDAAELLSRHDRLARAVWWRNLRSPLSMQIPVLDPDRFLARTLPLVQPLFSWVAVVAWLALMVTALTTVAQHWTELTYNILDRVMAAEGLVTLALCYPVIKVLHELGHGYAARRFGCEVHEMGIMLLVLFPVPYVDASASAGLRSKWQRAGVAAAGIIVELTLAAIATLIWVSAEPGLLRATAFNVMLIGGVSTLLINGNPLLRFDGYYVLSDVIEVPNLAQRAVRYLGYLVNRYVYRVPAVVRFTATGHERVAMLIYAPLSWSYRLLITVGVVIFVATHYFVVGVAIGVFTVFIGFILPAGKALWRIALGPRYRGCRGRAAGLTFGAIAVVVAAVLAVPAPVHSTAEGVIWVPQDAIVRAGTDGFVRAVEAHPGHVVAPGATLFVLEHPVAEAKLAVTEARVRELEAKYTAEWVDDRIAAEVTKYELDQAKASLAREQHRISLETVTANSVGTFNAAHPVDDMVGRYVKDGEVMGYVTPVAGRVARVVVTQSDIDLVRDHLLDVRIRLADRLTDFRSSVVRAVPAAEDTVPSQALTTANGGAISTDPRDNKGTKAFERLFQFDVALPDGGVDATSGPGSERSVADALAASGFGARVFVRFDFAWESLGAMFYRRIRQGLLSRFEI